ncbi:MAG: hypothetical protein GY913_12880 [Proteobacteria bacterium]|nr:hypothetical protein [Pseudomonadota bacterium]MCP4917801.1 hypothetical protein [Pseudomonadota bacterium]
MLVRHGKSSWKATAATDWERPLKGRGRRDAPEMGLRITQLGWEPDVALCSDAVRATETWERLGLDAPVTFHRAPYHVGLPVLRQHLGQLDPEIGTALVVGHNPGWEQAVEQLTGTWHRLTTCNVALLEGRGTSWVEALDGRWTVEDILRPRPPRSSYS